jgi:PAS domain S-box-containing protein
LQIEKNIDTETILDSVNDGILTIGLDYKITYINRAAANILAIDAPEAVGQKCFDVFHANICESACIVKEILKDQKTIVDRKIYIVNANGEKVPVLVSCSLMYNDKNEVSGFVETFRDISELTRLKKVIEAKYSFEDIISKNSNMQDLFKIMPDIAESDSSVLIQGKTGTGKELIARALHNLSNRTEHPFITINCAALPETLLESELFGHKKGAFTDAKQDKPGRIATAEKGTLFLDEIGEVPLSLQVKLLRFLQTKTYEPLGSNKPVNADVRIISATNRDLHKAIADETFRSDLFYRLNVVNIILPELKNRKEDIDLLIKHFINKYNALKEKNILGIANEAKQVLLNYNYPGNIRELENIIEHCFVLCKDKHISSRHLPKYLSEKNSAQNIEKLTLSEMEQRYIQQILTLTNGNKSKTAQILGIDSSTLWRKLKKD